MPNKWKQELKRAKKDMIKNKALIEANPRVTKAYKRSNWRLGKSASDTKNE